MLNQVVLVGRLRSFEDFGIIIEVPRPETNAGADLIPCTLTGNIANNTKEYCNIGDLIICIKTSKNHQIIWWFFI